jgi:hypothetical protein
MQQEPKTGLTPFPSLIVVFTGAGQSPCSGAKRREKEIDEISTAICWRY